jgi:hypothetical protein
MVRLSYNRLAVNGSDCAQFRQIKIMSVEEIETVARDDNLPSLASVAKRVQENSRGGRMQRALRFLNSY